MFGLQSLIDESRTTPPKLIKKSIIVLNDEGTTQVYEMFDTNIDYILWDRQSNIEKNWIYISLTQSLFKHMISKVTLAQYWSTLAKVFNDEP